MSEKRVRGCARAPVRVDPAGGGTDAPPFCVDHGGLVVNFGVSLHAYAYAERLESESGVMIYASDLGEGVHAESVAALRQETRLEFLRAFIDRLVPEGDSLLLVTESGVPAGSGLGGSGAIGVAVVAAIDRAYGRTRSQIEIAALANEIERKDLGYPGGDQDSFGAALGGMNRLEYPEGGGTNPVRLDVSENTRRRIEQASLLVFTGAAHVSGSIHEDIKNSYALENSPTVAEMFSLREAAESMSTALESDDLAAYVDALNQSCQSLYALHSSCDSEAHRKLIAGLGDLMLGAKTCGAGGGGFLLVHADPARRVECLRRAEKLGARVWPLLIDASGVVSWDAEPSEAAGIERIRARIGG